MDEDNFGANIAVVGLGLIGGSYAKAFKRLEAQKRLKLNKLIGIDTNKETIEKALKLHIIDEGYNAGIRGLKEADLVIIALYPKDTVDFVKENMSYFKQGAVITDTCGIKENVIAAVLSFLPDTLEFVGGHPMAGKESQGLDMASEDLFRDTNYIITPHAGNHEESIRQIEKMARALGCKSVVRIAPQAHDRIISATSHLPHVIAVSLMNEEIADQDTNLFIGGSFKDATRVANINAPLWLQIFSLNAENIIGEIERFEGLLFNMKKAIKQQDHTALETIFNNAAIKRRKM